MNDNVVILRSLIKHPLQPNPAEWAMDVEDILSSMDMLSDEARKHIANIKSHGGVFQQHNDAVVAILKRALKASQNTTFNDAPKTPPALSDVSQSQPSTTERSSIFIVHGHDTAMKSEVARILEQQNLDAVILSEQPANGMTIIEKLEYYAKQSAFAVVLYSKDDRSATGERARQNVVFEHGFFVGYLGRHKVIALKNGDVEGYSDIAGIEYIHYENLDWKYKLIDALKAAGFNVSRDRIKG